MKQSYDTLSVAPRAPSYPTQYDMQHRRQAILRQDAMVALGVAVRKVRALRTMIADSNEAQQMKTEVFSALHFARTKAFEARLHGFRIPG